jgi:hypothetical protein
MLLPPLIDIFSRSHCCHCQTTFPYTPKYHVTPAPVAGGLQPGHMGKEKGVTGPKGVSEKGVREIEGRGKDPERIKSEGEAIYEGI